MTKYQITQDDINNKKSFTTKDSKVGDEVETTDFPADFNEEVVDEGDKA